MTYDARDHDENPADGERVAKALARAGVASRREVERLIEAGRVAINGTVLTTPAVKIAPGDILTVDGEVVGDAEPTRVFRYHKPVGLVTSHNDPQGRPTVFGALPPDLPRLISVGRLDLNSEGLLLLTNDGALSRALELPSSGWPRTYRARAFGDATQEKLDRLKKGVTVEGVKYGPIEARLDKAKDGTQGRNVWITVTLTEGKNREVRRVLESLGLKVNRLLRLAYGPFVLGDLATGQVEEVGPRVIREQLEGLVPAENMPKGDRPQFVGAYGKTPGRRAPTPGKADLAARGLQAPPEEKPKTEYKPGWARPKSKPNPHGPSKAKPSPAKAAAKVEKSKRWVEGKTFTRPEGAPTGYPRKTPSRGGPARDASNRGRTGRVLARAEDVLPGATPRGPVKPAAREPERRPPKDETRGPGGAGDRGDRGGKKPFAGKPTPRPEDALRDAAAKGAERDAARRAAKPFGRDDAPRKDGPRKDGPRKDGPRNDGPRKDGPRPAGKGGFGKGGERGGGERPFDRPRHPGAKGPPRGGPKGR